MCWSDKPQDRLDFTQLKHLFESMISAGNIETSYINIEH